ncbi:bacillithiol biosynthesis deacetylase BshB1 [soil metagenome]
MKLDILAFGAHPDDVELGAGGMIAKEVALGRRVGIIDLTRGELGSRGTAEDRDQEAYDSAEILGIELRANLGFRDGFFSNDEFHQREIVRYIRLYQPDLVICNAVTDRHPDHGRGSELVSTACFLSGLAKIKTEWEGLIQGSWRPKAVYHYNQDRYLKPDVVVDITDFMETKMKAVKAFKTQFYNPESNEPETAISTREFLDFLYGRAMEFGRPAGFKYAESFTVERTIGIKSLMDLT